MKPSPSCEKLCEVFDFFLQKSLEPMKAESLMHISPRFEAEKAERYADTMVRTVISNSEQEFHEIINENQIFEKLGTLDELKQSDGVPVNMRTFTFTPARKEDLKSREEYKAKERFLQNLKKTLESLDIRIDELRPRAERAQSKVEETENRIKTIQSKIARATGK